MFCLLLHFCNLHNVLNSVIPRLMFLVKNRRNFVSFKYEYEWLFKSAAAVLDDRNVKPWFLFHSLRTISLWLNQPSRYFKFSYLLTLLHCSKFQKNISKDIGKKLELNHESMLPSSVLDSFLHFKSANHFNTSTINLSSQK